MNGRIYDSTLGRFLQADPHIQAPDNSQNYNRYSYVLNNPLSYTDPSGYFFKKLFKGIKKYWRQIASVGMMFIPGMQQFAMATWYNAAAVGFVSGGIATGSLRGALVGAFSGAALQQIGTSSTWGKAGSAENVIANASVGGIASDLNGGKFGHGFFAAGFTASLKPQINQIGDGAANYSSARIAAAAVVGGTASAISGGKFANGAVTGAFTQMFNAETQLAEQRKNFAMAMRNHISGLDPSTGSGRAMIAGWAKEFGYENQEMAIIRSEFKAEQYQGLIVNSLSVDVNINALKIASKIANGASTSTVDLGRATDNSMKAVTGTQIGTAMQVIGAVDTLQQYYNNSNSFSQSMKNFDANNVNDYAARCGDTIKCW